MNQPYLDTLNDPQRQAVLTTEGPLLVLAGAGTGKTKVLTTRLAHILYQGLAQPNQIMAVTFTNKAAREMAERVELLMGRAIPGMWLGTFHSLAVRLLRHHPELVGLTRNFSIIDADDQTRTLKQILKAQGVDDKKWPARQVIHIISRFKDNAWLPDDVPEHETHSVDGKIIDLYRRYQLALTNNNACDFGDLLLKAYLLLKNNPELLAKYQQWFKYVLVDEYQDTNTVQYLWIRLLTMAHKNICVVGDDDQSIYGWRGAQVGNILRFEADFPGCAVVKLEQNYRSTGHILTAAGAVISHNHERHDKTLWSAGDDGEQIQVHALYDGKDEARWLSRTLEAEHQTHAYNDMAILLRTAAQTRPFEEQFMKDGVPYTIVGGLKFYERKEIRDAVAYLRLVTNETDGIAFERIVNVPKRGMGDSAMKTIREISLSRHMSLMTASRAAREEGLMGRAANKLEDFHQVIDGLRAKITENTPDRLMEQILEASGYLQMLRDDKNRDEAAGRLENIKELLRALRDYDDVAAFLEHVSLVMDNEQDASDDMVRMTTVHAAKGLEFDTVFIPGFEEGLFPHQRSMNEEGTKGLEEERRLAYVAMTRAKRQLFISYVISRYMFGSFEAVLPSRFLSEMPAESLQQHDLNSAGTAPWQGGSYNQSRSWQPQRQPVFAEEVALSSADDASFGVGTRIFHQKFGYGRVRACEGSGASEKLTIAFEKAGEKKILTQFAKLERA